jgi:hypothetical protein
VEVKPGAAFVPGHATGVPLAVTLTGGHRNDVTRLIPLLDTIPPIRGAVGRPWRRPRRLFADRGYDHDEYRRLVRARGITPVIARPRRRAQLRPGQGPLADRTHLRLAQKLSDDTETAPNAEPTSTKPSSAWPAQKSSARAISF